MSKYDDYLAAQRQTAEVSQYDDALRVEEDQDRVRLRASVAGAIKTNPDQYAKARRVAGEAQLPVPVVERNLEEVERNVTLNKYDRYLRDAPALAGQLQNPDFAKLAHQDADELARIEARIRQYGEMKAARGPEAGVTSVLQGLWESFKGGAKMAREGQRIQLADAIGSEAVQEDAKRKYEQARAGADLSSPEFDSSTAEGIYSGVSSFVRMIPGLAASLLTRSVAPALATAGIQTETEAYGKYRTRGATGGEALAGAVGEGGVEVATEMLPMGFLIKKLGKAGAGEFIAGLLARELPSEQVATLLQDAIDTAVANPDKTWGEYIEERPGAAYQTLLATLTNAGLVQTLHVAGRRMAPGQDRAQHAQQDAEALTELTRLAEGSKLRERDPESFKAFVEAAAADSPVQDIWVDGKVLLQSGVNLEELAQQVPAIREQLIDAAAGGDVRIPIGDYSAYVAGTPAGATLLPHLKVSPDAMSAAEAETFMQSAADQFKQEAERVVEAKAADTVWQESAKAVETEIAKQLQAANRFTPDVNNAYAVLTRDFYSVMAQRLGITPQEMFARYPLQVRAENMASGQTLDQNKPLELWKMKDEQWRAHKKTLSGNEAITAAIKEREAQLEQIVFDHIAANTSWVDFETLAQAVDVEPARIGGALKRLATRGKLEAREGTIGTDGLKPSTYRVVRGEELKQATPDGARGQINFGDGIGIGKNGALISLLRQADLSTFLHESGHFYFEVLRDIASQPNAPAEVVADMDALLKFVGIKGGLYEWNSYKHEERREGHEKVARAFEAYLFEGKAPNVEVQGLFNRFRAWLLNVYKSISALNIELSDEVRGVFDRMLATDAMIKAAETARHYAPLFESAEQMGANPNEWQAYQELAARSTQEATEELQRRGLRDMQWMANAKGRELKRLQKEAADKRKAVRAEVEAEVKDTPIYAARRFIASGDLPGFESTGSTKLDLKALREMYGEEPTALWRDLPEGRGGLIAEGGLPPQQVAEMFGFTSGDHLVRELLAAEPEASVIEGMTDQRMLERYGDLSSADAIERAAHQAIQNETRARFIASELKALDKAINPREDTGKTATDSKGRTRRVTVAVLPKAAKAFAETLIARKRVRDIKPAQFEAAEARAAKAATAALKPKAKTKDAPARKSGNLTEAATEKRNQLVNHYAARAAHAALEEVEKGIGYLRRFDREAGRKSLDADYVEQIDQLLERFDLRRSTTQREIAKRKSLNEWIEAQREQGFEPTISRELMNEANRTHYSELTLEQFRGLLDAVKNIEHLGRLKKKLLAARDQREFAQVVDDVATSIRNNATGTVAERRSSDRGPLVPVANFFRGFTAEHRKFASLTREMDGFKEAGAMWEVFTRTMNERGTFEAVEREKATIALAKLFAPIFKGGKLGEKSYIPAVGKSFTREERLGIALNMGNEVNRERVMSGENWNATQTQAMLDTLTKEEWDFVQGVWDYFESYRPQIGEKQKRVLGVEPEWVEAQPVQTRHGQYKGGYYPIKYDALRSSKAEADTAAEVQRQMERGLYTRAQTRRGHLEARAESTGRAMRYDLGVITQHIDQVVHDLAWHEWLIDANRLLRAGAIDHAIRHHYGPDKLRMLKDAVRDIAIGDVAATSHWERALNHVRVGATIAGLGWNVVTSLLQPLGLTQSAVRIGPKWVAKGIKRWLGDAARMEATTTWIYERSEFMRLRGKTMQREINEIRNRIENDSEGAIQASFFWMIQKMQMVADVPTWLGAYEKAMEQNVMDEATAIALADQAVLDSQGGGQSKDLAAIQRGSPGMKLWTNFYSYFNTTYNLAVEQTKARNLKSPVEVGLLAGDYLMLIVVPAVLGAVIKSAIRGDDDDETLLGKTGREVLNYAFGMMIGLRELNAAVQGFQGYAGTGGVRFFAEINKFGKQVQQGEWDKALLKAANNVAGILFHYPSGQVQRTVEGIAAVAEGKTANPLAIAVGPPR